MGKSNAKRTINDLVITGMYLENAKLGKQVRKDVYTILVKGIEKGCIYECEKGVFEYYTDKADKIISILKPYQEERQ